jgi:hypothetical protein
MAEEDSRPQGKPQAAKSNPHPEGKQEAGPLIAGGRDMPGKDVQKRRMQKPFFVSEGFTREVGKSGLKPEPRTPSVTMGTPQEARGTMAVPRLDRMSEQEVRAELRWRGMPANEAGFLSTERAVQELKRLRELQKR